MIHRSNLLNDPFLRLLLCMLLLSAGSFLAFAPDAWLAMLVRAFMLQWTILFALFSLLVFFSRTRAIGVCATACTLMSASQLAPLPQHDPLPGSNADLRILHMNVLQPNDRRDGIISQALKSGADLIAVQEVDRRWAEALAEGLESYPYRVIEPRSNCYGIALFSRSPLIDAQVYELQGTPVIEASIMMDGKLVKFVTAHATSPTSRHHFRKRNGQIASLADRIDAEVPTILAGDFNSVQWDDAYGHFCSRSGLRPITSPQLRTWPAIGPIALIPIDHFFISPHLACVNVQRIELPGSDHFGLLADISLEHAH